MKRTALVKGLLSALLGISLAGCSAPAKEPVDVIIKVPTLSMNAISNPEIADSAMFMERAVEKYQAAHPDDSTNFVIEVFDYVDEGEAIVGSYDTEDATDLLYEGYFNMAGYMNHDRLASLDDIITDEIRADISESSWKQSQKNGATYMMPFLSMQNILAYNKALFEECGLEEFIKDDQSIQNWTLDEWNTILDTLAEKLPEGSYPMFMYSGNNQGDTHIMLLLRSHGGDIFAEDGTFDFTNPKVVEALEWIQSGVDKGWYAPHAENLEMTDNQQLFKDDRMAVFVFNNGAFVLYDDETAANYGFVNFPGNLATSFITGFEIFDNGNPEKVAEAKKLLQFIYEDEELMDLSAGNLPESKAVSERYKDEIRMMAEFTGNAGNVIDFMNGANNWQGREDSVRSVFWKEIHEMLAGNQTPQETAERLNEVCNAALEVDTSVLD